MGNFGGYVTRGLVGTASQPIVEKVWLERPNIPTWQKVLGVIAWPLMLLTPHGWLFLAASFVIMVMLGRFNPYSWAVWVTKASSWFLLLTVVGVVIYAIAASGSGS